MDLSGRKKEASPCSRRSWTFVLTPLGCPAPHSRASRESRERHQVLSAPVSRDRGPRSLELSRAARADDIFTHIDAHHGFMHIMLVAEEPVYNDYTRPVLNTRLARFFVKWKGLLIFLAFALGMVRLVPGTSEGGTVSPCANGRDARLLHDGRVRTGARAQRGRLDARDAAALAEKGLAERRRVDPPLPSAAVRRRVLPLGTGGGVLRG